MHSCCKESWAHQCLREWATRWCSFGPRGAASIAKLSLWRRGYSPTWARGRRKNFLPLRPPICTSRSARLWYAWGRLQRDYWGRVQRDYLAFLWPLRTRSLLLRIKSSEVKRSRFRGQRSNVILFICYPYKEVSVIGGSTVTHHGLRWWICRSSPFLLKNSSEYCPERAICRGMLPSNSMMCAKWSERKGDVGW